MSVNLLAVMAEVGQILGNAIKSNAQSANIPSNIAESVRVGSPTQTGNNVYIIDVSVGGKDALSAVAYEYGSGVHRTRGQAGTYPIKPKNKKALAFRGGWNPANPAGAMGSRKFLDYIDDEDLWIFANVDHPGVAPRPFAAPAVRQVQDQIRRKISQAFRQEVITRINEVLRK